MAKKRQVKHTGRTRGSVTRIRSDPTNWLVRIYTGTKMVDAEPERQYASKTVRGTYRQADAERMKPITETDANAFVAPTTQTATEFVTAWLDGSAPSRVSEHTAASDRQSWVQFPTRVIPVVPNILTHPHDYRMSPPKRRVLWADRMGSPRD